MGDFQKMKKKTGIHPIFPSLPQSFRTIYYWSEVSWI